jgi:hypothetical protein
MEYTYKQKQIVYTFLFQFIVAMKEICLGGDVVNWMGCYKWNCHIPIGKVKAAG